MKKSTVTRVGSYLPHEVFDKSLKQLTGTCLFTVVVKEVGKLILQKVRPMKPIHLKQLVEQMVRKVLTESSDSKEAFKRFRELKNKHKALFYIIEKADLEFVKKVLEEKEESEDYSEFFKRVGPGERNHRTGYMERTNAYGLQPWHTRMFWDLDMGIDEIADLFEEYKNLDERFEYKDGTTTADGMYGRSRTIVVDKLTGEKVASFTDREGSLGT